MNMISKISPVFLLSGCLAIFLFFSGQRVSAQIPDVFENLELLPADISKKELTDIMGGFTRALGVGCKHCHVVGKTPGFASDEKEPKKVARVMMLLTKEINDNFLPKTGRDPVLRVKCVTCHRGQLKPDNLQDVLMASFNEEGVEGAVHKYRDLREKSYGRACL